MEFHLTLDRFYMRYGQIEKEDFVDIFHEPFLVFDMEGVTPADFDSYADSSKAKEPTVYGLKDTVELSKILVAPIVKSDRNQTPGIITLGRTPKADIVIPHESISKFHAFFERNPAYRTFTIQDADSSFGTVVNGRTLESGENVPLKNGHEIIFADSIGAVFYTSSKFFDFMVLMVHAAR